MARITTQQERADVNSPHEHLVANDLRQRTHILIARMPKQRQKIFRLSRLSGFSNEEIAKLLGISKKTVENHLNLALGTLRKMGSDYCRGTPLCHFFPFQDASPHAASLFENGCHFLDITIEGQGCIAHSRPILSIWKYKSFMFSVSPWPSHDLRRHWGCLHCQKDCCRHHCRHHHPACSHRRAVCHPKAYCCRRGVSYLSASP